METKAEWGDSPGDMWLACGERSSDCAFVIMGK